MNVAIIGAGPAGLASGRRALQYGLDCTIFEKTDSVGGIWVYNDETRCDENNIPVTSCMYASLKTNLPTQLMEFTGFKFQPKSGSCFPGHEEVLQYINDFAEEYDLLRYIKFNHRVIKVAREDDRWNVSVKDVKNDIVQNFNFDAVMVCSGHNSKPFIPYIPGSDTFNGHQIHSHAYRRNLPYKGKLVLIVGSGASGRDIALECAEVAKKVYLCCGNTVVKSDLGVDIVKKPNLSTIDGNNVFFSDCTSACVDAIIYCTGYEYYFPFLDDTCGLETVDRKILRPLYKKFLNIEYPTICFVGLLQKTFVFALFDLLAEVFVKLLTNRVKSPSKNEMRESFSEEVYSYKKSDEPASRYFYLDDKIESYFEDLARLGDIDPLPPVLFKIYKKNMETMVTDYLNSKKQFFEILDNERYVRWLPSGD